MLTFNDRNRYLYFQLQEDKIMYLTFILAKSGSVSRRTIDARKDILAVEIILFGQW